jgi:ATP-dependent helicase IRC3
MILEQQANPFYCEFNLSEARQLPATRQPEPHQSAALLRLDKWFSSRTEQPKGGLLVLPTGGGKTFTAMRFLCSGLLSKGYRILWLAHTHHLLEQALEGLRREVGQISEPKAKLTARVVSGTLGHCRVHEIKPTDDVLICTLQTVTQAWRCAHPQLCAFLHAAGEKLCVVFDEAHHSPAHSYRGLLTQLRAQHPEMVLLGLTATPTYSDETKRGWLRQLFPQEIIYQVTPQNLIAAGVMAEPVHNDFATNFDTEFDERDYRKWSNTYSDLPETIITQLAESRERNAFIAETYLNHRERYGKTIIFADRWFQCEQLGEFLRQRGVRAAAVYTHVDATPGTPEARNQRTAAENKQALEAFKNNELDVLLNVLMLTEGTDVPDVQTVFLTRQTTSSIRLTQMIGRALRGPRFGGTDKAYIVSFIDSWKHLINWANHHQLATGLADDDALEATKRPPLQYISIDLVRRLVRQMDTGCNVNPAPYLSLLPVGWYSVDFETAVAGSDDCESVRQMVLVFENEVETYQRFLEMLRALDLRALDTPEASLVEHRAEVEVWRQKFFANFPERSDEDLVSNLFHLARHFAQREAPPSFFSFDERNHHNLDALAQQIINHNLGIREKDQALQVEYQRVDRYWGVFYPNFRLFKSHYNACEERVLEATSGQPMLLSQPSYPEQRLDREPLAEVKEQVKARDGYRCVCCGETDKRLLEIDHVSPFYFGGQHNPANLQTLCRRCNNHKAGINQINFRTTHSPLTAAPGEFPHFELPPLGLSVEAELDEWDKFLFRSLNFFYRCDAIEYIKINQRGRYLYNWEISLFADNDARWLAAHLEKLLWRIRGRRAEAKRVLPESLRVLAPGQAPVEYVIETELAQA